MESYLARRDEHIRSATPGPAAARALSDLTDEAVRALARTASSSLSGRWALMALGGWGSGALLPDSDLDLLVLSDARPEQLRPFVEALLYPLWDAGLHVGHQVRSPRQQVKAMRDDLTVCTSALTARPLAGDTSWGRDVMDRCAADARRRAKSLVPQLLERPRPGSPFLLEPDLKEGAGGRRDFDELVWVSAVLGGKAGAGLGPLISAGYLSAEDAEILDDCARVVSAARWECQRNGYGHRMSLDAANELESVDAEAVQAALARTATTLTRVRSTLGGETVAAPPRSPDELFELLVSGEGGREALETAAVEGALEQMLPGMRALMSCRRPGLGHELTVGAHSIRAATLALHPPAGDPALRRSVESLEDSRVLLAASLLHDGGKIESGAGHADRGAPLARDAATRLGLSHEQTDDVADLVRLHLLLVETALRDDLDHEDVILRCSAAIGRPELLAPLHALTAADSRATGRATWTAWTATLVATLVSRLDVALSPESDGAGLASRGEAVRSATLELMDIASDAERRFVGDAPLRYLAGRTPDEVRRHGRLVAELAASPSATEVLIEVSDGPAPATAAVTVVAVDRPELLTRLSGAMALSGLDILSVDAYGGSSGIALDHFVVTSATARPTDTETFVKFERLARAALRDRLELAVRLEERRKHYPSRAKGAVEAKTRQRGWATELTVSAPDRPGLLHDIAEAVSANGLDIRWARVQTIDGIARDVFHLSDENGGPVDDAGVLGHVAMQIRAALRPR